MNMPMPSPAPRREWVRTLGVFLATLIILVSLPTIAVQEYMANKSQNNHHAASVKQQDQILALVAAVRDAQKVNKGTLTAISRLQQDVSKAITTDSAVILALPVADAELGQFAAYSISVNQVLCTDIVIVAKASGLTLPACPAVPKFAPLGSPSP